jgi:hypothetical protein
MITREEIKREIDKLPDNLLEELYLQLKNAILRSKQQKPDFTIRNFKGSLDKADIRKAAYE